MPSCFSFGLQCSYHTMSSQRFISPSRFISKECFKAGSYAKQWRFEPILLVIMKTSSASKLRRRLLLWPKMFQSPLFHGWTKNSKIYPKYCRIKSTANKIMSFNWGRFTSMHGYGPISVAWMLMTGLRKEHCFVWIKATKVTFDCTLRQKKMS